MDCGAVKTEKQAHSWEDEDYDEYYTYYYENKNIIHMSRNVKSAMQKES